jgi:hypothetical protein
MSQWIIKDVAKSIPFDNSTNGFTSTDVQAAIEETKTGGSGVVPPFVFSKDGNVTVGTYLRTGSVQTSATGQLIKGSSKIVEISASCDSNAASTTRIQFFQRTGVSSRADITGAYVDIPSGNYKGTRSSLSINIGPDWEIGCYSQSGSTIANVVVVIYLTPQ